jgi:LmbE family N-acetylglucosaminyl deacetylase
MSARDRGRRRFLQESLIGLPLMAQGAGAAASGAPVAATLRVVCVGGHPDDPESGCGGTLARYAAVGHSVTVVYLTRGERGIAGRSLDEAAAIRTREAEQACRILGATPRFAGQIDGATELNAQQIDRMTDLLKTERPDVLLTHWPIDTHRDHQVASLLTMRAWLALGQALPLYFFEVNAGHQTMAFRPTDYVDITAVGDTKRRALVAHESQDGAGIDRVHHEPMARFRGREIGVTFAEAFVRLSRATAGSFLSGL